MNRRAHRLRVGAISATVVALVGLGIAFLWPAASASGSGTLGGPHIAVQPAVGSSSTDFRVSFTAQRTGYVGSTRRGYEVVVNRPDSSGAGACISSAEVAVPTTHSGQRVHVKLHVAQASRGWCQGTFKGQLEEWIRPVCPAGEPCPLISGAEPAFIAVLHVGRFYFRVR